ncbi:12048_t:CDS:2, partial [Gigaspora margarita]
MNVKKQSWNEMVDNDTEKLNDITNIIFPSADLNTIETHTDKLPEEEMIAEPSDPLRNELSALYRRAKNNEIKKTEAYANDLSVGLGARSTRSSATNLREIENFEKVEKEKILKILGYEVKKDGLSKNLLDTKLLEKVDFKEIGIGILTKMDLLHSKWGMNQNLIYRARKKFTEIKVGRNQQRKQRNLAIASSNFNNHNLEPVNLRTLSSMNITPSSRATQTQVTSVQVTEKNKEGACPHTNKKRKAEESEEREKNRKLLKHKEETPQNMSVELAETPVTNNKDTSKQSWAEIMEDDLDNLKNITNTTNPWVTPSTSETLTEHTSTESNISHNKREETQIGLE